MTDLAQAAEQRTSDQPMPVVFIGRGSPRNALRDSAFTRFLTSLGQPLPKPAAVLSVSAH